MVFKLIGSAQSRWRAVSAPGLVAFVPAGVRFARGMLVEREASAPWPSGNRVAFSGPGVL
jgi:putative transposase